jgi:hypothetical protein
MDERHANLAEGDGFNLHLFWRALESTREARDTEKIQEHFLRFSP